MNQENRTTILQWLKLGDYAFSFSKDFLKIFNLLPSAAYSGEEACENAIEYYLTAYLKYQDFDINTEKKNIACLLEMSIKYDSDFGLIKLGTNTENNDRLATAIYVEGYLNIAENIKNLVFNKVGISQQEVNDY